MNQCHSGVVSVLCVDRKTSTAHVWECQLLFSCHQCALFLHLVTGFAGRFSCCFQALIGHFFNIKCSWSFQRKNNLKSSSEPKVVSAYYMPCPMELAISCAFILKSEAEFGNKGSHSKFAVTGDAVHLQSLALVYACQVQTWTHGRRFQMFAIICQFSVLSCMPVQKHLLCRA